MPQQVITAHDQREVACFVPGASLHPRSLWLRVPDASTAPVDPAQGHFRLHLLVVSAFNSDRLLRIDAE